jgi:hypothetical protein
VENFWKIICRTEAPVFNRCSRRLVRLFAPFADLESIDFLGSQTLKSVDSFSCRGTRGSKQVRKGRLVTRLIAD